MEGTLISPPPPQPFHKHADLWFCDGSVILQAECTLFRVHKSQLSRRSVVFSDMFTLPQPAVTTTAHVTFLDDVYEGCPIVKLHDSAEDVTNLLLALYDGPKFNDNDPNDFAIVSGILRLSTKYAMDSLRSKAIAHLNIAWPTSLKGWDLREDMAHAYDLTSPTEHASLYPSPIDVINLSRETNVPSLLPAAFYDLSRYTFAQIFEPMDEELSRFRGAAAAGGTLSADDMRRLALGKEASAHAVSAVIHGMGRGPLAHSRKGAFSLSPHVPAMAYPAAAAAAVSVCSTPGACRRDFAELVELATQHYVCDRERGYGDPLYVAEELGALKSADVSECRACARALEIWAAKERERMWKMIPLWFRMDS
ncbi:hypothetical protein B0F90DRAFT_1648531 [Multifurca ochricompacta]|uniref:BTB domain-containing protein n=1 Tax=Multifurca ochricompacta TaxID=376703 RepID=A0AAD4QFB6_9AGAM|nr:hypothetical protein B0F90DRAFT_1648531 [Multifurca ochricompacta]